MKKQTTMDCVPMGVGLLLSAAILAGCVSSPAGNSRPASGLGVMGHRDDDEVETPITLGDLPPEVRAALAGITSEDRVTQVTRDEADGVTSYDVEYTKDGAQWAVEFSPDGEVLEHEADDDGDDGDD